jgi:hypothetical protein
MPLISTEYNPEYNPWDDPEKPHPVGWRYMTEYWWQFVCILLLDVMVMVVLT